MVSSGMTELSSVEDVGYVRDALLPGHSDTEATTTFKRSAPHTPTPYPSHPSPLHSLTHSLIHSLTHSHPHSFTPSPIHTHTPPHSTLVIPHPGTPSLPHPFAPSPLTLSPLHSLTPSPLHSLTLRSLTPSYSANYNTRFQETCSLCAKYLYLLQAV